jgi:Polyketide cyclase / dehydrase and lipid transport
MAETSTGNEPLFAVRVSVDVSAPPERVYGVVTDLPRSGAWSEECTGGEWVSGPPATVGSVFRGENFRPADVVAWAPVVRGRWETFAEVVVAEPGREFGWSMRDSAGGKQDSVWSFDVEPAGGGSVLTHRFRMGRATEGIRGITAAMDETERKQFCTDWGAKLERDMAATLGRIKAVIERT